MLFPFRRKIIRLGKFPLSSVEGCVWWRQRGALVSAPMGICAEGSGTFQPRSFPGTALNPNVSKDFHLHSLAREGKIFLFQWWLRHNLCTWKLNVFHLLVAWNESLPGLQKCWKFISTLVCQVQKCLVLEEQENTLSRSLGCAKLVNVFRTWQCFCSWTPVLWSVV